MAIAISQMGGSQIPVESNVKRCENYLQNKPSFKGKTENDQYVKTYEVEATSGKKWGVGIASAIMSGLGQAINGEWGKALGFFAGGLGTALIPRLINSKIKNPSAKIATAVVSILANLGIGIASIVDAVKNAKTKVRIVDEKGIVVG